jgi:hypothetical protein
MAMQAAMFPNDKSYCFRCNATKEDAKIYYQWADLSREDAEKMHGADTIELLNSVNHSHHYS